MSEIKIDKDVPIPSKSGKYPWDNMEVGDSFYIDVQVQKVGGRITHVRKKWPDRKWVTRKEGVGTRVWRVK